MSKKVSFFKEAIKNYKTSGTLVPSSKFLANRMLNSVNFSEAKTIIELGPGNGAITKAILEKMTPKTTLICFEINDVFYQELQQLKHPNIIILNASAENLEKELKKLKIEHVDYVISSLPLTIIPNKISTEILKQSYRSLKQRGLFIQYQYSLTYYKKLKGVFGKNIILDFETFNFPPAFVYKCVKK